MKDLLIKPVQILLCICFIFLLALPAGAQAGEKVDKMHFKLQALELLKKMEKEGTQADAKKLIDSALGNLDEKYKTGNIDYQRVLTDVTQDMNQAAASSPKSGTLMQFWYNIRFNGVVDKAQMSVSGYLTEMSHFLKKHGASIMRGQPVTFPGWGGISAYRGDWGFLLRHTDYKSGWAMIIQHLNGEYTPWRFFYIDLQGTKDVWEYNGVRFRLVYTRSLVNFLVNNTKAAAYTLIPTRPDGPKTIAVPYKGSIYAVTLDASGKFLYSLPLRIDQQITQGNALTSKVPSARLDKKKVVALSAEAPVTHFPAVTDTERRKIGRLLKQNGMPGDSADILCKVYIKNGDSIYIVGSAFFKGTWKQLRKGNYGAGFFNTYADGTHIALFAQYKKNKLNRVECSDGFVYYDFKKNSYSLSLRRSDLNRDYLCSFKPDGSQTASRLMLKDLGIDIQFDGSGTMTNTGWGRLKGMQIWKMHSDGKTPINYKAVPMEDLIFNVNTLRTHNIVRCGYKAIQLINTRNNKKEIYSRAGHRVEGAYPFALQTLVRFPDKKYRREVLIPGFNSPQGHHLVANFTVNYFTGVLFTDLMGRLHMKVTQSTPFGTVVKSWDKLYKPSAGSTDHM